MERKQVDCGCKDGQCFLETDKEWIKRNSVEMYELRLQRKTAWEVNEVEAVRLQAKNDWLDSLNVGGTCEVCCHLQAKRF
ncbi:MAG: hypothetical protein HZB71_11415 [Betaproteobacteria bacterium]|nr:hypothetical protein [Betaproteobacteria bacterium]